VEGLSKLLLLKEKQLTFLVRNPVDNPSGKKWNDLGRKLSFIVILSLSTAFTINLSMTTEHDIHNLIHRSFVTVAALSAAQVTEYESLDPNLFRDSFQFYSHCA
jgi:hypothetical protein